MSIPYEPRETLAANLADSFEESRHADQNPSPMSRAREVLRNPLLLMLSRMTPKPTDKLLAAYGRDQVELGRVKDGESALRHGPTPHPFVEAREDAFKAAREAQADDRAKRRQQADIAVDKPFVPARRSEAAEIATRDAPTAQGSYKGREAALPSSTDGHFRIFPKR